MPTSTAEAEIAAIDERLTDCVARRRRAREAHDAVAELVLTRQIERLLDWRNEWAEPKPPMIHR